MEKISRILPTSSRFRVPDLDYAHAARPGAPEMGLKAGVVSTRDRVSLSVPVDEVHSASLSHRLTSQRVTQQPLRETQDVFSSPADLVATQGPVVDTQMADERDMRSIHIIA